MQEFDGGTLADDTLAHGWNGRDLARASGLSVATVSRAFRGSCQNPKTWDRLAKALGRTLRRYLRKRAA